MLALLSFLHSPFRKLPTARLPILSSSNPPHLFPSIRRKPPSSPSIRRKPPFFPADSLISSFVSQPPVAFNVGKAFSSSVSIDFSPKDGAQGMEPLTSADRGQDPNLSNGSVRSKIEDLNWDHSFVRELPGDSRTDAIPRQVLHACYTKVLPSAKVENPELVVWSEPVAELLDLDLKE